jgi:hypothetical protein
MDGKYVKNAFLKSLKLSKAQMIGVKMGSFCVAYKRKKFPKEK